MNPISFDFLFFVTALLILYFSNRFSPKLLLFIFNIGFLLSFGINNFVILVGIVCISYILYRSVGNNYFSVYLLILVLFYFKLNDFISINYTLPIGLSFLVFRMINILLNGNLSKLSFTDYFNYSLYFPQLLSGPIASTEQDTSVLEPDRSRIRPALILLLDGLTRKLVVSGSISFVVNYFLAEGSSYVTAYVVLIGYVIHMYFDFSGYVNISNSITYLLTGKILVNFNRPFFAISIPDYWSRWHITLTKFFERNIHTKIILNLRQYGLTAVILGLGTTFFISSIWHGNNINYFIWGLLHFIGYIPMLFLRTSFAKNLKLNIIDIPVFFKRIFTFHYIAVTLLFFNFQNFHDISHYFMDIDRLVPIAIPYLVLVNGLKVLVLGGMFILREYRGIAHRTENDYFSIAFYLVALLLFGNYHDIDSFIYFKF